jgi:hypothetical protein
MLTLMYGIHYSTVFLIFFLPIDRYMLHWYNIIWVPSYDDDGLQGAMGIYLKYNNKATNNKILEN